MQDIRITIIQSDIHWEDIDSNLEMFEDKINQIGEPTDIIVLPEMFSTGFSQNTALAEMMGLRTFLWMKHLAEKTNALIIGSVMIHVHHQFFNRILWVEPGGQYKTYDKRHLFSMANEQNYFSAGESILIGQWRGWRICPLICYDLRFPVWSCNKWNSALNTLSYDVLIYVANWPHVRIQAWEILLKARAIENLSYVVGVNRVGTDGYGVDYNGQSSLISPKGDTIFSGNDTEVTKTISLSSHALQAFRDKFPAYLDADEFVVEAEAYR